MPGNFKTMIPNFWCVVNFICITVCLLIAFLQKCILAKLKENSYTKHNTPLSVFKSKISFSCFEIDFIVYRMLISLNVLWIPSLKWTLSVSHCVIQIYIHIILLIIFFIIPPRSETTKNLFPLSSLPSYASVLILHVNHDMTKPTNWECAQRRLRSAWAFAQSDQSLRCPHEESFGPSLPIKRTAKTLIRLGECPGWSESSLGAQSLCWFCHVAAHVIRHYFGPICLHFCPFRGGHLTFTAMTWKSSITIVTNVYLVTWLNPYSK